MNLKFLFSVSLVVFSYFPIYAQSPSGVVRGRVVDSQTLEPLPLANIYINFTTIGTSADANGEFVLMGVPVGNHDFVVSHIGHQSYQTKINVVGGSETQLIVKLIVSVLKDVEIKSKKDAAWEAQLAKFKKLFFGNSPHSALCKIFNPWSLEFKEDDKGNFIATATTPLEIENLSLGYRITYQLRNFSVGPVNYSITGYVRFRNILTNDSTTTAIWSQRRAKVYEGSYRHLFKAIIEGKSREEGFELYEDRSGDKEVVRSANFLTNVNKSLFVFPPEGKVSEGKFPGQYAIQLPPRIEVHYLHRSATTKIYSNVANPISWIEVNGGFLEVNNDGVILNPLKMTVSGVMGEARIAEILPYDYQPPILSRPQQQVIKKQVSAAASLMEKPYLHTDRSYYFPHEVIWFEGYVNYPAPMMKDSLSKVLYVDIMNSSKQIIATRLFPIVDGRVNGSFPLLPKWGRGDFVIRAYTRWMLNFSGSYIFTKPIKIIDYNERVKAVNISSIADDKLQVKISASREEFKPRDKVTLLIDTKDFYGYSKISYLSISVTDLHNAVPVTNDKNILSHFSISPSEIPDSLPRKTTLFIQKGIEMKGKFVVPKKKKPMQGLLTFYQEESSDMFNIVTKDDGEFFMPNLFIYDTAKLYAASKSVKGKKTGKIILDSVRLSPDVTVGDPLQIEIDRTEYNGVVDPRTAIPDQLPAHLLENVTINDTRVENFKSERSASVIHDHADFVIDEDWIRRAADTGDLLSLLQTKVPGLKVITIFSDVPTKYIILGGPNSVSGPEGRAFNPEPLVLLDGQPLNTSTGTAADQLAAMNPATIQRIEIIKYGGGAAYGLRGGNGVIAVYTIYGKERVNHSSKLDKTQLQEIKIKGYSNVIKFNSPDYSKMDESKQVGDYRITLYWNPEVVTDGKRPTEITFYAADLPTQYRIVVEGVDSDNRPVRGEKLIAIKD